MTEPPIRLELMTRYAEEQSIEGTVYVVNSGATNGGKINRPRG